MYFKENVRNSILSTFNSLKPGVLTNIGNQYIHLRLYGFMNLKNPTDENPIVYKSISINKFRYNNNRSNFEITWEFL